MQHKMLKLSTLAVLIAGVTQAQAAVYKVVEVPDNSDLTSLDYFSDANMQLPVNYIQSPEFSASAISQSSTDSCFTSDCGDASDSIVVGQGRWGFDGLSLKDTVPFLSDNYQHINDREELERYCLDNLGFNTCDTWAKERYYGKNYNNDGTPDFTGIGGLQRQQAIWNRGYFANTLSMVDGNRVDTFANDGSKYGDSSIFNDQTIINTSTHVTADAVTNGIINENGQQIVYGITSSAVFEHKNGNESHNIRAFNKRGFVNIGDSTKLALNPVTSKAELVNRMGQTQANGAVIYKDKLLVVGSAAYAPSFYYFENSKGPNTSPSNKNLAFDSNKLPSTSDGGGINIGVHFDDNDFKRCFIISEKDGLSSQPTAKQVYDSFECQFSTFANEAAFWSVDLNTSAVTAGTILTPDLYVLDDNGRERSYQASARAISIVNEKPIAVGFSTVDVNNDYYANSASIFKGTDNNGSLTWSREFIPGLAIKQGDDRKYSYTTATDINDNGVVIGVGKNYTVEDRSYPESMFVYKLGDSKPTMLHSNVSGIFFDGSNGYASAINNKDQVVGWVDTERVNQADGRQRRQRAFTYLYDDKQTSTAQGPINPGDVWMLDDLTNDNGSAASIANQFRIAQATDINNAGVISATALKCEGGYSDLSSKATCAGSEQLVAVKLVPIKDGKIEKRPEIEEPVKRSGGSLGVLALTVLGFIGFRRRK
ncbi:TPA: DUF3466 family protein [Photobacterium damselae]